MDYQDQRIVISKWFNLRRRVIVQLIILLFTIMFECLVRENCVIVYEF